MTIRERHAHTFTPKSKRDDPHCDTFLVLVAGDALAKAADLQAAVPFALGFHGPDLLLGVASYLDEKDDEWERSGSGRIANRQVQTDIRRWVADLNAALAAWKKVTDG